ncbi:hypothetical protein QQ045_030941 [Rhodiola kirilowii]
MSPQAIVPDIQPPPSLDYLPEDALCQIFSHLHHYDILKSSSLVCKQFCSLSSPLVHRLSPSNTSLTYYDFDRLFKRFPDVKNICIDDFHELDKTLLAISKSDLNLEKLRLPLLEYSMNLQYPEASTIENMSMSRVIKDLAVGELTKSLELRSLTCLISDFNLPESIQLNLNNNYRWNDKIIHKVTSKLPNLQKISLNYNDVLTDQTLVILSTNCPKLESVDFRWLSSVGMPNFDSYLVYKVSKVVLCVQILKNLNRLSLESDHLEDAVLIALAESQHPLKHLLIDHSMSQKYTMAGLSKLLSAYPGLESLDIHLPHRKHKNCETHDAEMSIIVKKLPNLKQITNCPLLETIVIERDDGHLRAKEACDHAGMERPTKKNYSIKSIQIIPKAELKEVQFLKMILHAFEGCSGLKINFGTSMCYGIGLKEEEVMSFAEVIGCLVGSFQMKYLGMQVGVNPAKKSSWEPILGRFKQKLASWRSANLSMAGRVVLIKSALCSLPLYYASIYKIPISVAHELEKIQKQFLRKIQHKLSNEGGYNSQSEKEEMGTSSISVVVRTGSPPRNRPNRPINRGLIGGFLEADPILPNRIEKSGKRFDVRLIG